MGFGTIVASVIMFTAVMLLASAVFVAMKNDISEQSDAMREQSQLVSNSIKTSISIESLQYDNATNITTASIRNIGKTKLSLDYTDVYIDYDFIPRDTANRTIEVGASTDTNNPGIWDPNEVVQVVVQKDLPTGQYTFKVSVQYGVSEEDIFSVAYG